MQLKDNLTIITLSLLTQKFYKDITENIVEENKFKNSQIKINDF